MQRLFYLLIIILSLPASAQLKVSDDKHYLIKKDGTPFFWLGDTAWELFHRLSREEAKEYLQNRSDKGFTIIQAVALAELDGLNTPNFYGDKPLIGNNPAKLNEAYFKHVDFIVNEANKRGLIIALLPTWADKWYKDKWGTGPEIFTPANAKIYGELIAKRYLNKQLVWVLGGDRNPQNETHFAIIRAMAEGIKNIDKGQHLLTYHPSGGASSFDFFAEDKWIDFHMSQTGHRVGSPDYKVNSKALSLKIIKPHVNGEPNYEDHPNNWDPAEKGWMDDFDTREAAYWNMLSGGAGHTYGNHNIWQMYSEQRIPINNARTNWHFAMNHLGAYQVGFMRKMFEKRNWQKLVPDQSVIIGDNAEGVEYKMAAVSSDNDFLMVYIPYGRKTVINTSKIKATKLNGWWFNPRDGKTIALGEFDNAGSKEFTPTSVGRGSDWVLVLDDASKKYSNPWSN
ncbi:MAG: glycoside hydrolase family 140 protein [Ginsengibacter sp.]